MNHRLFLSLGATLLLAVPVSTLLPGCGGGNSGIAQGTYTSTVALSATKTGFLTLTTGGGSSVARGTLRVTSSGADARSTEAFTFAIPDGTYQLSGSFSPPNSFSVTGSFPGVGPFFINGQIPTNGGNGNYSITTSGQTVNGNFATGNFTPTPGATTTGTPHATTTTTGTPTATATTGPTATATSTTTPANTATPIPATTGNNRVENILFSNVSGANARSIAPITAGITGSPFFKNDGGGFVGTAFFQTTGSGVTRKLTFEGPQRGTAVSAGETFPLGTGGEGQGLANLFYSEIGSDGVERSWAAQSGTYSVVSGDTNRVNFSISNAKFAPAFNANGATGLFTLNGRGNVGK